MTQYDDAIAKATEIGREHGENAAYWDIQHGVSVEAAREVLRGIQDGDPEVLDRMPHADLSGEWADGYTPRDLWDEATGYWQSPNRDEYDGWLDALCDAYENAFSEAVEAEIVKACQAVLA